MNCGPAQPAGNKLASGSAMVYRDLPSMGVLCSSQHINPTTFFCCEVKKQWPLLALKWKLCGSIQSHTVVIGTPRLVSLHEAQSSATLNVPCFTNTSMLHLGLPSTAASVLV